MTSLVSSAPQNLSALEAAVRELYEALGDEVSAAAQAAFDHLVKLIVAEGFVAREVLLSLAPDMMPMLERTQKGAAQLEAAAEREWAKKILHDDALSSNAWVSGRYEKLIADELAAINRLRPVATIQRFVFVGAGPLPLSAVELHKQTLRPVMALDVDAPSVLAAQKFLDVSQQNNVTVGLADGAAYEYAAHDCVVIATLVPNKQEVLRQILKTSPLSCVAVRSARGLGEILYQPLDEGLIRQIGWQIMGKSTGCSTLETLVLSSYNAMH